VFLGELMAGSSLIASKQGIQKAKKALEIKSLTQKALAVERGIASWSTINHFFNGIAVQRQIFIEICEELDLDWQDIVETPTKDILLSAPEQLWLKLQKLGSPTEQMGLVLVQEETLGWGTKLPSPYKKSVPLGSLIRFEVNFDFSGYLLLLQKDTQGQMLCFCPSCFAPQPLLNAGKTILPQPGSSMSSFPIEGEPGNEQVIAIITKEVPTLDWLSQASYDTLELDETHLQSLLDYIATIDEYKVLHTQYSITA
jgi:Domain of unknown function (DUF4384)